MKLSDLRESNRTTALADEQRQSDQIVIAQKHLILERALKKNSATLSSKVVELVLVAVPTIAKQNNQQRNCFRIQSRSLEIVKYYLNSIVKGE